MAANYYSLTASASVRTWSRNGVRAAVVVAESSADAKAALQSLHETDSDVMWANCDVASLAAGTDLAGWTLKIDIITPTADANGAAVLLGSVSVVGAASATVDSIAALAVTALNSVSGITHAAYNSGTNVLTIAGTADAKGDHRVNVFFYPPGAAKKSVPGFIGTVTAAGLGSAALTVALAADAYTVPAVIAKYKAAEQ